MQDGTVSIFLSTRGENEGEISDELVRFLKFVGANLEESKKDFADPFIKRLQESIRDIKLDREMENRYMFLYELTLKEERKAGYAEGEIAGRIAGRAEGEAGYAKGEIVGKAESILEVLSECGEVPEDLRERVLQETDLSVLSKWLKAASRVQSVSQFIEEMQ